MTEIKILARWDRGRDIYWAIGRYEARAKEGQFELNPIDNLERVIKFGVLEQMGLTPDLPDPSVRNFRLNEIVWKSENGNGARKEVLTPEGSQKIREYLQAHYAELFPASRIPAFSDS